MLKGWIFRFGFTFSCDEKSYQNISDSDTGLLFCSCVTVTVYLQLLLCLQQNEAVLTPQLLIFFLQFDDVVLGNGQLQARKQNNLVDNQEQLDNSDTDAVTSSKHIWLNYNVSFCHCFKCYRHLLFSQKDKSCYNPFLLDLIQ